MKRIKISELKSGSILAENIYRSKDVISASNEIPIIAKGTVLTEEIVNKLKKILSSDETIEIVSEKPPALNINQLIENNSNIKNSVNVQNPCSNEESHDHDEAYTYYEVLELYKKSIFQKEIYQKTKTRLNDAFTKVIDAMQSFINTKTFSDETISGIGRSLAKILTKDDSEFDPSLVYLVEIENWDETTFNHSFDVATMALAFGLALHSNTEELASLFIAGIMHDIGKYFYAKFHINEMDYIIKKPDKLTTEEFKQMQKHVEVEGFLNERFKDFDSRYRDNIIYAATEHHEKFAGGGYIKNKKGMEISYSARLIALCDVFDALIRERPYKTPMKPNEAIAFMGKLTEEGQFDPVLYKRFYKVFGKYPIGSVIRTNMGLGVAVEQTGNPDRPILFIKDIGEIDSSKNENLVFV